MKSRILGFATTTVLLVACIAACGSGAGDGETDGVGGAGMGGNAASAGTGAAGSGGPAGGAAGAAGRLGTAGESTAGDDLLMPLAAGRVWTFEVQAIDAASPMEACEDAESVVIGTAQSPAGLGWLYDPSCEARRFIMVQDGDDITAYSEDLTREIHYMRTPVLDGAAWDEFRWESSGSVTVPAGTFEDCWRRTRTVSEADYVEFCRGVGLVRLYAVGANRELRLVSVGP
jgi:hypothetical protein